MYANTKYTCDADTKAGYNANNGDLGILPSGKSVCLEIGGVQSAPRQRSVNCA